MPDKRDKRGFPIPSILEPAGRKCVVIQLPDEPGHLAAFWGQFHQMCQWYLWARDDEHSGAILAGFWQTIYNDARESFMQSGDCADIMDCSDVETCIDFDEGVDRALTDWLLRTLKAHRGTGDDIDIILDFGTGDGDYIPVDTVPEANEPIMPGTFSCEPDLVFGFCRQTIEFIHYLILDVLEKIELATNNIEAVGIIVDTVPGLSSITDAIDWMYETVVETYQGQYDQEIANTYACELFCLALTTDCELTVADMFDYFGKRLVINLVDYNGLDWIEPLIGLAPDAYNYVDAMFFLAIGLLATGTRWSTIKISTLLNIMNGFLNDPDSDHTTVCDECPQAWRAVFDLVASDCDMIVGVGTYTPGVGIVAGDVLVGDDPAIQTRHVAVYFLFTGTVTVTQVYATLSSFTPGIWQGSNSIPAIQFTDNYSNPIASRQETLDNGAATYVHTYAKTYANEFSPLIFARCSRGTYSGALTLSEIEIRGIGDVPQEILDAATLFEYL